MQLNISELKLFSSHKNKTCILEYNAGYGREITKFSDVEVIDEENVLFTKCRCINDIKKCITFSLKLNQILKVEVL